MGVETYMRLTGKIVGDSVRIAPSDDDQHLRRIQDGALSVLEFELSKICAHCGKCSRIKSVNQIGEVETNEDDGKVPENLLKEKDGCELIGCTNVFVNLDQVVTR
jgi:hypothetical protein